MNWREEWPKLAWLLGAFLLLYNLPIGASRFDNAILEAFHLVKWYAREHVLLCLVPAFFIAGAVGVFVSQNSVMRYLGAKARRSLAYAVASVSGSVLAVCSCTILPLFAGIYRMGAGLGPACAFLYAGPAINILAMILTARILGLQLGLARALGAVIFSILIGLLMQWIFRKEEQQRIAAQAQMPLETPRLNLGQTIYYFASMVGILVFANWAAPQSDSGIWFFLYQWKWPLASSFGLMLAWVLVRWFQIAWWKILALLVPTALLALLFPCHPLYAFSLAIVGLSLVLSTTGGESEDWFRTSWDFALQILPLLLFGVLIAGLLLGRVGQEGLIPPQWILQSVGGNSLWANFFASFAGAFMYFATLTEVPILQGLLANGMGKGPALALLLAGPALSLPNMLVIHSVLGWRKTATFVALVVLMATISGWLFGLYAN